MVPPTKDIGIRLGWDDEQVLIWQNRQLKEDPSVGAGQRLDAPLGVTRYYIDARRKADGSPEPPWTSLNLVSPRADMKLAGENIMRAGREVELGTEVYPMQLSADQNESYCCPPTSLSGPASPWSCPTRTRTRSTGSRREPDIRDRRRRDQASRR